MTCPTIKIIAVDGPAGCGKSTIIQEVVDQGLVRPVEYPVITRPRDYDTMRTQDNGSGLSMIKNHNQLISAFKTSFEHGHDVPIILDRWALSQYVYGTLRQNLVGDTLDLKWHWKNELNHTGLSLGIYLDRKYVSKLTVITEEQPDLEIWPVIYLPEISIVKVRRAKKSKPYPFDVDLEWHQYNEIVLAKLPGLLTTANSSLLTPKLVKIESLGQLIDLIREAS